MAHSPSFGPQGRGFLGRLRPFRRGGHQRPARAVRRLQLEALEARELLSGVWTPINQPAPDLIGTMLLQSDGTVMAQGGGSQYPLQNTWYRLTPDSQGSYINGTWSQMASMNHTRLYYASNVLPDARVFVLGGEYSDGGSLTRTGEIYDPLADKWTPITNFPQSNYGDDPSVVLQDGRILTGYVFGPQTYLYDPTTDTWTQTGTKLDNDQSDEEGFTLLPDGSVLTADVFANQKAQRYYPSTGTWVEAGTVPVQLSNASVGYEMGPSILLNDGRVFYAGATNHTAYYDPSSNTWTAGPDLPSGMGADDSAGALLPNGHFLFTVDHPLFGPPASIYELDPVANTLTKVDTTGVSLSGPSYWCRMVQLPSQQILLSTGINQLYVYTPDGGVAPGLQPVIRSIHDNGDGTFGLAGVRINGISEGASYGDDAEMSSNYPIVQLTDGSGNVYYGRTYNWQPGVVQGNYPASTQFTLPASVPAGDYSLAVIGSGIASNPVDFQYAGPPGSATGTGLPVNLGSAGPVRSLTGSLAGAPALGAAPTEAAVSAVSGVLVTGSETTGTGALGTGDFSAQAAPVVAPINAGSLTQETTSAAVGITTPAPWLIAESQKAVLDNSFASDSLDLLL